MFGPIFLVAYRLICWRSYLMRRERGRALRAGWALWFSSWTDGGLDDDFAEEAFRLVRETPALLDQLEPLSHGNSFFAARRRMLIATLRQALASGVPTLN